MSGYKKSASSSSSRSIRAQMDEESSARRLSGASASSRQQHDEEEEEEEEEEEGETRISSLGVSSVASTLTGKTSVEDILALVAEKPEILKMIVANNQEDTADMLVVTRAEEKANRMMDMDAEKFAEEYKHSIKTKFKDIIGDTLVASIKADHGRRNFFKENKEIAAEKFVSLNEYNEKFSDIFQDAFEEVNAEYREDFFDVFGQHIGLIEHDEEEEDASSDYEEGVGTPNKKRRSRGGSITPSKKGRGSPLFSPGKEEVRDGDKVKVYVLECEEWQTRTVGNKNTGGYISKKHARDLLRDGYARMAWEK